MTVHYDTLHYITIHYIRCLHNLQQFELSLPGPRSKSDTLMSDRDAFLFLLRFPVAVNKLSLVR